MSNLSVGDTIQCSDKDDLVEVMDNLSKEGVYCDWMFERDGKKGYWLIVDEVEE